VSRSKPGKIGTSGGSLTEILVDDTDSESGAEANEFEDYFEEAEEEQQQQQQALAEIQPQEAKVADYQPGDRLKGETQIFIHLLVHPKV